MKYLYLSLVLCMSLMTTAQSRYDFHPCGTPPVKSEWLKNYQKDPSKFQKRSGEILWVPLSVTLVGEDDGSNYISERTVHESLCTLNDDFMQAEIQFYLAVPFRYLKNSIYASHDNVVVGAEMMFANNLPDMINTYIVGNASGFCGYNLPYAGVVMSAGCASADDHTWAHEIGHNLSVQHPFLGWEGGYGHEGSPVQGFSGPAPETVTYDYTYFKDTLILDTMIIDTAFVEKMDGSNCTFAADGFCDTKPDYLAFRWPCMSDLFSQVEQIDPDGVSFRSDGRLIMSYATDNCSSVFSPEQIGAMRANLIDEKASYLGNENVLSPPSTDPGTINSPELDEEVYFEDIYFEWEPVDNATAYTIQLALFSSFGGVVFDTIVYENFFTLNRLRFPTNKHFWRYKALNEYNFCSEYLAESSFQATETQTSIDEKSLAAIDIYPTSLFAGQSISIANTVDVDLNISVRNISGIEVYVNNNKELKYEIPTSNWIPGVYLVSINLGKSIRTTKIIITK